MNQVQATRLVNMAVALRDAHRGSLYFNMGAYGFGTEFRHSNPKFSEEHNCGTPACALGHYAARTDLQKTYKLDKEGDLRFATRHGGAATGHCNEITAKHFGLTWDELDELFETRGCGDATDALSAARYIEDFVKRKGFDIVLED